MSLDGPILGIDTTGNDCVAAIVHGHHILAEQSYSLDRGHAERLFPLLFEIHRLARLNLHDLVAIVVVTGPGNHTGARLSIAAARGLSLAMNIPATGVNGFETAAFGITRPCCAVIAATGGRVHIRNLPHGQHQCMPMSELTPPPAGTLMAGSDTARQVALAWGLKWQTPDFSTAVAAAKIAATHSRKDLKPPVPYLPPG